MYRPLFRALHCRMFTFRRIQWLLDKDWWWNDDLFVIIFYMLFLLWFYFFSHFSMKMLTTFLISILESIVFSFLSTFRIVTFHIKYLPFLYVCLKGIFLCFQYQFGWESKFWKAGFGDFFWCWASKSNKWEISLKL